MVDLVNGPRMNMLDADDDDDERWDSLAIVKVAKDVDNRFG